MAEPARVLDYDYYNHGSAAPARQWRPQEAGIPVETPRSQERARLRERARAAEAVRKLPGISLFAIVGSITAVTMMVFVILAQITFSQTASEAARLNSQLMALTEQHRRLEIAFESVIDMNEIERYARDVVGMTRPHARQTAIIKSTSSDRGEVLAPPDRGELREFGTFISSLLDHFR
jgi:cell division protein FtsL